MNQIARIVAVGLDVPRNEAANDIAFFNSLKEEDKDLNKALTDSQASIIIAFYEAQKDQKVQ